MANSVGWVFTRTLGHFGSFGSKSDRIEIWIAKGKSEWESDFSDMALIQHFYVNTISKFSDFTTAVCSDSDSNMILIFRESESESYRYQTTWTQYAISNQNQNQILSPNTAQFAHFSAVLFLHPRLSVCGHNYLGCGGMPGQDGTLVQWAQGTSDNSPNTTKKCRTIRRA